MDKEKPGDGERKTDPSKPANTDVAPPSERVDDETGTGQAKTTTRQE